MDSITATPERGALTISYTWEDGLLLAGSRRGDGVWELLKTLGSSWTSFRSLGCLGFRGSRNRPINMGRVKQAVSVLEGAGFTVTVEIDETRPPIEQQYADTAAAADERVDRYTERAQAAGRRADAAWRRSDQISEQFYMGQPILTGHYSERQARRAAERMDAAANRSLTERRDSEHWAGRAQSAGRRQDQRETPDAMRRRVATLQARARVIQRELDGTPSRRNQAFAAEIKPAAGEYRERLLAEAAHITEEVTYLNGLLAKLTVESGLKQWSRADFSKGDWVRWGGCWFEIIRINASSLTIPDPQFFTNPTLISRKMADERGRSLTFTVPYTQVGARRSAASMTALLESPEHRAALERKLEPANYRVLQAGQRFAVTYDGEIGKLTEVDHREDGTSVLRWDGGEVTLTPGDSCYGRLLPVPAEAGR